MKTLRTGLVGDRDDRHDAHRAIPIALARAASSAQQLVEPHWIATPEVARTELGAFDALWCVPASPYASMDGALAAIRFARARGVPFLGTCGGFQHALLEYARDVLGMVEADHAETSPNAALALIAPLACALRGVDGDLRVCAVDTEGEVRAIELRSHPFFVATLFQPERSALAGRTHPLVVALVQACYARQREGC